MNRIKYNLRDKRENNSTKRIFVLTSKGSSTVRVTWR